MIPSIVHDHYRIIEKIGEGASSIVYRAVDTNSGQDVAIKHIAWNSQAPNPGDMIRMKNETRAAARLKHPGIATVQEVIDLPQGCCIVMEYIEGESLARKLSRGPLSIEQAIHLMQGLCDVLSLVHEAGIIHRDLKPGNIIIRESPDQETVPVIIDFGLARIREYTVLPQPVGSVPEPHPMVGTLLYASPEQLGPDAANIDERSDLYSLGVVFFEMVTARPPFDASDPSLLIHLHRAKMPVSPSSINVLVPDAVSVVIQKLLGKNPDERYQSARGLGYDLAAIRAGQEGFVPGRHDRPGRIEYLTRLIGRTDEYRRLFEIYKSVQSGKTILLLISASAGMGKSRLVEELRRAIFTEKGNFTMGKCRADTRNTPYGPFIEVIDRCIFIVDGLPESRRRAVHDRLNRKLGRLAGIMVAVNPSLGSLLGDCPPPVPIEPDRERARFLSTMAEFFMELARALGSLVIALDDLQWADESSLALLRVLAPRQGEAPLLIIATYRSEEVDYRHPLKGLILRFRENRNPVEELELLPLGTEAIAEYCSIVFQRDVRDPDISVLAEVLYSRGQGNPLFTGVLLRQLVEKKAVTYDANNQLLLDRPLIARTEFPDEIAELLIARIDRMDAEDRDLLSMAALIGREFDSDFLVDRCHECGLGGHDEAIEIIDKALSWNLLAEDPDHAGSYRFAHDAIREAFVAVFDSDKKNKAHRMIAAAIESKAIVAGDGDSAVFRGSDLFEIIHHYKAAGDLRGIKAYAYRAGCFARENHAYGDALTYFTWALENRDPNDPHETEIRINIAEAKLLTGLVDEAIREYDALIPKLGRDLDRADAYQHLSSAYFNKGDFVRCEQYGRVGLSLLGERLPIRGPGVFMSLLKEAVVHMFHRMWENRGGMADELESARYKTVVWFYYSLSWMYFAGEYVKLTRTSLRMLNLAESRIGKSRELGVALSFFGVLCTGMYRFEAALFYHERALRMRQDLGDEWGVGQSQQTIAWCHYCSGDFTTARDYYRLSVESFERIGDKRELGNALSGMIWTYALPGNFEQFRGLTDRYYELALSMQDDYSMAYACYFRGLNALIDDQGPECESYLGKALQMGRDKQIWIIVCLSLVELARYHRWIRQDIVRASDCLNEARIIDERFRLHPEISGTLYCELVEVTVMLAAEKGVDERHNRASLERAAASWLRIALKKTRQSRLLRGFALRAGGCLYALQGKNKRADLFFRTAIDFAEQIDFMVDACRSRLAYGMFLQQTGKREPSRIMAESSFFLVSIMDHALWRRIVGEFLQIGADAAGSSIAGFRAKLREEGTMSIVIELARDISRDQPLDIMLDKTLAGLMKIIGASYGSIIQKKNGELAVIGSVSVDGDRHFSRTIVQHVFASGTAMLATDARDAGDFNAAESVSLFEMKSVLCVPIRFQSTVIGVCYLSNPFTAGVFSEDDIGFVQLAMDQLSVRLQNSVGTAPKESSSPQGIIVAGPDDAFCSRYGISPRERELIILLIQGYTRKGISQKLTISYATADTYIKNVYEKLGVNSKAGLIELISAGN